MTSPIKNADASNVTCAIALNPANGQALANTRMTVTATISQDGNVVPQAKGKFSLTGGATFVDTGTPTCDVQATGFGTTPPVDFIYNGVTSGNVSFTSTAPSGGADLKQYQFVAANPNNKMTLTLNPASTPAGPFSSIEAKAWITGVNEIIKNINIVFELQGLDTACFTDTPPTQKTKVVAVDDHGYAIVYITDSAEERGVVRASGTGENGNAFQDQQIAFSAPSKATLTLTPDTVSFEAAGQGQLITINLTGADGKGISGDVILSRPNNSPIYFVGYGNGNEVTVTTNEDGVGTVTLNAFTWCKGVVRGNAEVDGDRVSDQVAVTSEFPAGLSINVSDIDYDMPPASDGGVTGVASFDEDTTTWVSNGKGGPATESGVVRVQAEYRLNGSIWGGYGNMVFSVDTEDANLSDKFDFETPVKQQTVVYNPPDSGSVIPSGFNQAVIFMKCGVTGTVPLAIEPDPGANVTEKNIKQDIEFGSAWATTDIQQIYFAGSPASQASIYQNYVHQAVIKVVINLHDAFGQTLTTSNQPTIEDVMAGVKLVDFSSGAPYSVAGQSPSRGSMYAYVVVDTKSNYFNKEILLGSAAIAIDGDADDDDGGDDDGGDLVSSVSGPQATLYYYLTFSNGMSDPQGYSTSVGMIVTPNYEYQGGVTYNFCKEAKDKEKTVTIDPIPAITYRINDNIVLQTVARQGKSNENDTGPQNESGEDDPANYQRRWDAIVSLANTGRSAPTLFGAFMTPSVTQSSRETEDCVIHDIKWGGYQTKAYFWQNNNYLISENDYNINKMDSGEEVKKPDGQSMTLAGVTLPADDMAPPAIGRNEICVTIVAGFGDLERSAGKWNPMKLKLVDCYGNVSDEFQLNPNVPQPGFLLNNMANNSWLPLSNNVSATAPAVITSGGVKVNRVTTTDNKGNDNKDQERNMYWQDPGAPQRKLVGGLPLSATSSTDRWTLTPVDASKPTNERLYRMSGTFGGQTYYTLSYNSKTSDSGYPVVVGVTDVNSGDYVLLKPYWAQGAIMIYAVRNGAVSTDGTYWQWDTAEGTDALPVMVFSHRYGASVSPMSVWTFDVSGQSAANSPPPQSR